MQWFKPFTQMAQSSMGVAETHAFSGRASARDGARRTNGRRFLGTFAY